MKKIESKNLHKQVAADTIALAIYSAIVGIGTTLLYERALAGFTWEQWAALRVVYNVLRFGGARLCGKLTNWVRWRIGGDNPNRWRKAVADGCALAVYQEPIYIVSALLVGVTWQQIALTAPIYILDSILFGWVYGIILDSVRKRFPERKEQ